jgi:hypothetical protein
MNVKFKWNFICSFSAWLSTLQNLIKFINFSTILLAEFLYRIFPRSDKKHGKYRQKFMCIFKLKRRVIEQIFKKSRSSIAFAENSYAEFHENLSTWLVAGTRPHTEEQSE